MNLAPAPTRPHVALIGFGEAGSRFARAGGNALLWADRVAYRMATHGLRWAAEMKELARTMTRGTVELQRRAATHKGSPA